MADFYPLCSVFQASLDIVEWLVTSPLKSLAQIYRIALGKSGHRSTSKHARPDKFLSCRAYGLLYRQSWLIMVMRGEVKLSPQQMSAMIELLPFHAPKLSAVGVGYLTNDTFAEKLER